MCCGDDDDEGKRRKIKHTAAAIAKAHTAQRSIV
jgi:hypothetical protein